MWEGYRGPLALQGACGAHPASGAGVTLAKRLSPISQALLCSCVWPPCTSPVPLASAGWGEAEWLPGGGECHVSASSDVSS